MVDWGIAGARHYRRLDGASSGSEMKIKKARYPYFDHTANLAPLFSAFLSDPRLYLRLSPSAGLRD